MISGRQTQPQETRESSQLKHRKPAPNKIDVALSVAIPRSKNINFVYYSTSYVRSYLMVTGAFFFFFGGVVVLVVQL